MQCYLCEAEVYWNGDDDYEIDENTSSILSNYTCSACEAFIEVYHPEEK